MTSTFIDDYEIVEKYNARWLKLLFHNASNNLFFDYSTREALYSISNPNKYSIMKLIPRIRRYQREKYEFIIEYPGEIGYNRWAQRVSPLSITSTYKGDIGFEEIDLTWKGYIFSGLSKSYSNATHFSCSTNHSSTHYAIGAYTKYKSDNHFPGPRVNDEKSSHFLFM